MVDYAVVGDQQSVSALADLAKQAQVFNLQNWLHSGEVSSGEPNFYLVVVGMVATLYCFWRRLITLNLKYKCFVVFFVMSDYIYVVCFVSEPFHVPVLFGYRSAFVVRECESITAFENS